MLSRSEEFFQGGTRRLCAVAIAGIVALTTTASLADETAPHYRWPGFYVGGTIGRANGGNINLQGDPDFAGSLFQSGAYPVQIASPARGNIGGLQFGKNWQWGRFVFGPEIDFALSDVRNTQTIVTTSGAPALPLSATTTGSQRLLWLTTARLRAGYTVLDNLLIYGTGGLAGGRGESSTTNRISTPNPLNLGCFGLGSCLSGSKAATMWGWSLGAGLEYGIGPWSLKLEYLHYDLGNLTYSYSDMLTPAATITSTTRFAGDIVRIGGNFRFSPN